MMVAFFWTILGCQEHPIESDIDTATNIPETCEAFEYLIDPFIDHLVEFEPGEGAGFGQDQLPDIIFGPPKGAGDAKGSFDVLTLGDGGSIIVEFTDLIPIDGEGVDILVFENPFIGWIEPGIVSASMDGVEWFTWECQLSPPFEGCAGLTPVIAHETENCLDATDPNIAGGDGFDLADISLEYARFIKIEDAQISGLGGFDLDAIAVVNGEVLP